jgi:hypothetical protein
LTQAIPAGQFELVEHAVRTEFHSIVRPVTL